MAVKAEPRSSDDGVDVDWLARKKAKMDCTPCRGNALLQHVGSWNQASSHR